VIADAVADLVDVGSTNANGQIKIYTENRITLLATIELANPAFGAAASGVATALSMPASDGLADGSGTAAVFDVIDRDENVVFSGTVGEDLTLPETEVAEGDIFKIISMSYTAPP
jgi:hypothetical protein